MADKIRKLLKLSESSNPHEAWVAWERAQSLMKAHGLKEEDFDEDQMTDTVEILDNAPDKVSEILAFNICRARGCSIFKNSAKWLSAQGSPRKVADAKRAYELLSAECERACTTSFWDIPHVLRPLWKIGFRLAFAMAIGRRLKDAPQEAPPPRPTPPPRTIIVEASVPTAAPSAATGSAAAVSSTPPPAASAQARPSERVSPQSIHQERKQEILTAASRLENDMPRENAVKMLDGIIANSTASGERAGMAATIPPPTPRKSRQPPQPPAAVVKALK